jgi:hypothetical protein
MSTPKLSLLSYAYQPRSLGSSSFRDVETELERWDTELEAERSALTQPILGIVPATSLRPKARETVAAISYERNAVFRRQQRQLHGVGNPVSKGRKHRATALRPADDRSMPNLRRSTSVARNVTTIRASEDIGNIALTEMRGRRRDLLPEDRENALAFDPILLVGYLSRRIESDDDGLAVQRLQEVSRSDFRPIFSRIRWPRPRQPARHYRLSRPMLRRPLCWADTSSGPRPPCRMATTTTCFLSIFFVRQRSPREPPSSIRAANRLGAQLQQTVSGCPMRLRLPPSYEVVPQAFLESTYWLGFHGEWTGNRDYQ